MTHNLQPGKAFGDFDRIKLSCCEIRRGLPFNMKPLRMGLYIAIACLAGGFALVAVNLPHHNLFGCFMAVSRHRCLDVLVPGRSQKTIDNASFTEGGRTMHLCIAPKIVIRVFTVLTYDREFNLRLSFRRTSRSYRRQRARPSGHWAKTSTSGP
jgi:hypothetical protein